MLTRRKIMAIMLIATVVCTSLGLVALVMLPLKYNATMVIAPPLLKETRQSTSSIGASLLGLTSQAPPSFTRFEDLMVSARIAQALIDDHQLDKIVYQGWDPKAGKWQHEPGIADSVRHLFGLPPWSPPDAVTLAEFLKASIKSSKSAQSNAIILNYSNKNSEISKNVLKWVYEETEAAVIKDARTYYGNSVPYLENRLENVTNQEEKRSLIDLLLDSEEQLMLVNYAGVYAAEVVDGPYAPSRPTKSNALLILVVAVLAGPILSLGWIFGRRLMGATSVAEGAARSRASDDEAKF